MTPLSLIIPIGAANSGGLLKMLSLTVYVQPLQNEKKLLQNRIPMIGDRCLKKNGLKCNNRRKDFLTSRRDLNPFLSKTFPKPNIFYSC